MRLLKTYEIRGGGSTLIAFLLAVAASGAIPLAADAAKPYDAEVKYIEANATSGATSFFDTGLLPSDDLGVCVRFSPKQSSEDSQVFGAQSSGDTRWYFGGPSRDGYYFGRNGSNTPGNTSPRPALAVDSVYDTYYNYLNDRAFRISGVDGATIAFNGKTLGEYTAYTDIKALSMSGTAKTIHLFGYNKKGANNPAGWFRIYSARFTRGGEVAMDLVPVRKDGVGYMFDKVSGTLIEPQKASADAAGFACASDVADASYIEGTVTLDADADWTSRGFLRLDDDAVIDLNGHTLSVAGAFGGGMITDNSTGDPGVISVKSPDGMMPQLKISTSGNMRIEGLHELYDAQVEYLESTTSAAGVSHIDLGFYPTNDMGACVRFMPTQDSKDSVLFGAKTTDTGKNWYFGGQKTFYLSWNANPNGRPSLAKDSKYAVYLNYMNDRNRRIVGLDGAKINTNAAEYNLAITEELNGGAEFDQKAYLYTFNNKGSPHSNFGSYRIYSATFTKGDRVVMDLVPVRKDGVGYMYDKISNRLLGKRTDALPDFVFGVPVADTAWLTDDATLDADMVRNIELADGKVIDLKGRKLTAGAIKGAGTITDTSNGEPGELHIVVSADEKIRVSLALTGNLKVVKEGAGTLVLAREGQTFTGGVVVAEGVANAEYMETGSYWGPDGGEITIMPGAVFDNKGQRGFATKRFVLAGGTLANTGYAMDDWDNRVFSHARLTADSQLNAELNTHFWDRTPGDDSCIDLGGHTLTVSIGSSKLLFLNTVVSNGTIEAAGVGYLAASSNGVNVVKHGSDTLDLRMTGCALDIRDDMTVRDYYAGYVKKYNDGAAKLLVHGTFTPAAVDGDGKEYFHGCEMQDGSAIDLSAKSSAFGVVSTGFTANARTLTFADGATVRILLGSRTLEKNEKIIDWTAAVPENYAGLTFCGETSDGRTVALKARSGGVYVSAGGLMIVVQ